MSKKHADRHSTSSASQQRPDIPQAHDGPPTPGRITRATMAVTCIVALVVCVACAIWWFARSGAETASSPTLADMSGALNPLTADQPTLTAGRLLYQANCAVCHGANGNGDGPAASGLRPAPSDLTQHMQPGKHSDAQAFLWIRDGYPNTAMPAWGQRLSTEQIWQLVTYARTFALASTPAASRLTPQPTQAPVPAQPIAATQLPEPLPALIFARAGNIWRSDGAGAAPRQLTQLDAGRYAEYPTVAPNGELIAFITTTQGPIGEEQWPLANPQTSLALLPNDGTQPRLLWVPEHGRLGLTAWAADSSAIFVGYYDLRSAADAPVADRLFQIVRVDPRTGTRSVAMDQAYDPTFSRDGTRMAFLRWHADMAAFTLNVAALDGSAEREVIGLDSGFSDFYAPRFSPDGQQIMFASATGPPTDSSGSPIKASTRSAIGRLLDLFGPTTAAAHGARLDLWSVHVDGTALRRLTHIYEDQPMVAFAPDGKQVAVLGGGGIYLMDSDGSALRKIDPLGDHGGLDWAWQ